MTVVAVNGLKSLLTVSLSLSSLFFEANSSKLQEYVTLHTFKH